MLVQQTVATTAKLGMPSIFPEIASDLGIDKEYALVYATGYAICSICVMAGCGGMLRRWGPLRTSQIGCFMMAIGLAAAALLAQPWLVLPPLVFSVILNGAGSTVATPASSQILAKYAPPKWAPLVFSIKQTGVPAGLAIAGLIMAPAAHAYGWRSATLGLALFCLLIAIALQPVRAEFDRERDPSARPRWTDLPETIRDVLASMEFRGLALAAFCFVGMQSVFMGYTVTYLNVALSYETDAAGRVFGAAALIAVPARVFWGWVGSAVVSPRVLLAILAAFMAVSTAAVGAFGRDWSQEAVFAVLALVSLSVLSWHGVLLSETARLAGSADAGRMTGGVLAFGAAGQIVYPMLFGLALLIDGYGLAYFVIGLPAVLVAALFIRAAVRPV